MENHLDQWICSSHQLSRSIVKESLQTSESSQIIGRKLNSYHEVKPHSSSCNKPRIVQKLSHCKTVAGRLYTKSLSKSPVRSHSQKASKHLKDHMNDLPYYVSPPRHQRRPKTVRSEAHKAEKVKNILSEASNKILDHSENLRKQFEEKIGQKISLSKGNGKIREKNAKILKKSSQKNEKNFGFDKELFEFRSKSKSNENDDIRSKLKAEREASKRVARERLTDIYSQRQKFKNKDKAKVKKSPEPNIQKSGKHKSKNKRKLEVNKQFEENLKDKEKSQLNEKFEKSAKKKTQKLTKKKKIKSKAEERLVENGKKNFAGFHSNSKDKKIKKGKKVKSSLVSMKDFKNLEERVFNNYEYLKERAAIKIQRWIRKVLCKDLGRESKTGLEINTEQSDSKNKEKEFNTSDNWTDILHPPSKLNNQAIGRFTKTKEGENLEKLNKHQHSANPQLFNSLSQEFPALYNQDKSALNKSSEKSNISLLPLSTSLNFQLKRPQQLNIESIITPLLVCTYESCESDQGSYASIAMNESLADDNGSPTFHKSSSLNRIEILSKLEDSEFFHHSIHDMPTEKHSILHLSDALESLKLENLNVGEGADCKENFNEISLNSLNLQKIENLSSEESLQYEIGEISSALSKNKEVDSRELYVQIGEKQPLSNEIKISNEKVQSSNQPSEELVEVNGSSIEFANHAKSIEDSIVRENNSAEESLMSAEKSVENPDRTQFPVEKPQFNMEKALMLEEKPEVVEKLELEKIERNSPSLQLFTEKLFFPREKPTLTIGKPFSLSIKQGLAKPSSPAKISPPSTHYIKDLSSSLTINEKPSLSSVSEPSLSFEPTNSKSSTAHMISPAISYSVTDIILDLLDRELELYLSQVKFQIKEKEVDPTHNYIEHYLSVLYEEMKPIEAEILDSVNTPAYMDPVLKINLLQNTEIGELCKFANLDLILPLEFCGKLKHLLSNESLSRQVYLQMIFDCVNEAMNQARPFGLSGIPDPWALHPSMLFGEAELKTVFNKINKILKRWSDIKGGAYPTSEIDNEDKLQNLREERMSILLCHDVNFEETGWIDYEDEEAQTKFDLAEVIFEDFIDEIIHIVQ